MNPRLRRISADYEKLKEDFNGHPYVEIRPLNGDPPEKYLVIYHVNGIYLLPDGRIETQKTHEVEIELHAEYPRYKPICTIRTPIFHPNFRDGQVCIGDIWGAGESLTDIIVNIGDMIQYKSWNSLSPLSSEAAQWAIEHKHLFPVGTLDLYVAGKEAEKVESEIDIFDDLKPEPDEESDTVPPGVGKTEKIDTEDFASTQNEENENDFDINAEDLAGIEFIPIEQRIQSTSPSQTLLNNERGFRFSIILAKGIVWALIGVVLGIALTEIVITSGFNEIQILKWMGHHDIAAYYEQQIQYKASGSRSDYVQMERLWKVIDESTDQIASLYDKAYHISKALWAAFIALFLGLSLGVGEGVYYGSREYAIKYGGIGAGLSFALGFVFGYPASVLYSKLMEGALYDTTSAIVQALSWGVGGLGVGFAIGLIKPNTRRVAFCTIGGFCGGFLGGILFNAVFNSIGSGLDNAAIVSRIVGVLVIGVLIGFCIGWLEQAAKGAWLKVIRGDFEGKEYLVFAGVTSIGNTGKNTIVLFKDRLVGPHHCDIIFQGQRFVLQDRGSPMGTLVNGIRVDSRVLKHGDAISIGNSVLMFYTKKK